jgi:hypothetical protein
MILGATALSLPNGGERYPIPPVSLAVVVAESRCGMCARLGKVGDGADEVVDGLGDEVGADE